MIARNATIVNVTGRGSILMACWSILAVSLRADDWPQWRGPRRDGVSAETQLLTHWPPGGPPRAWHATGLGRGYATVAVVGGHIYTIGLRPGAVLKSQVLKSQGTRDAGEEPLSPQDAGSQQAEPIVVSAWNAADGQPLWSQEIGATVRTPGSTPTWHEGRLYALGPDGQLVCLDASSGQIRWRVHLVEDLGGHATSHRGFGESPLVDGDSVICTPGGPDGALVALNRHTGQVVWRTTLPAMGPKGRDGAGFSSAVISQACGVRQVVQLLSRGLIGVDVRDGRVVWHYNGIANDMVSIPTPLVHDDYVFAANGYSAGSVLLKIIPVAAAADTAAATGAATVTEDGPSADPGNAHAPRLRAEEVYALHSGQFQNHHGGVVRLGDFVYGGHGNNNGFPTCVEFLTGRIAWKRRGPGEGSAAVASAAGRLYFRYQNGLMTLIEPAPDDFHLQGAFTIPGAVDDSWPHPVIANGFLYLREHQDLWVYDVRDPKFATSKDDLP